jgi:hypothetical protein
MRWSSTWWLVIALSGGSAFFCGSLGCAPTEPGTGASALEATRRLVPSAVVFAAPEGGDGATRRVYAWEHADGTREPSGLPVAIDAQEHRGDVYLVTPDARLLRFADGDPTREQLVARSVIDRVAVSPRALAYVVIDEGAPTTASVLHRREEGRDVVLDRTLYALGALTFAPDERTLIGVGSVNGGVAGLHVFDDEGRRCLTNCELRTGVPTERPVECRGRATDPSHCTSLGASAPTQRTPLPASPLRFDGDEVRWDDEHGVTHAALWRSR